MLGLPAEMAAEIAKALAARDGTDTEFTIWPENETALNAFLASASQWRTAPAGLAGFIVVGLDYGAVKVALDAHGIGLDAETFSGLQVMEAEAVSCLNEARDKT